MVRARRRCINLFESFRTAIGHYTQRVTALEKPRLAHEERPTPNLLQQAAPPRKLNGYPLVVLPCKNGIFSVAFTPFFTAVTPCGPTRCGAASGPRQCPLTVPPRAGAPKRTWDTLEDRVTARVTPHLRVSRRGTNRPPKWDFVR